MLSVRAINVFTPRAYAPWLAKATKMALSFCAFGCANRFGALQGPFLVIYANICEVRRKQRIQSVKRQSWAPSKYAREYVATIFVSFKLNVQKPKLTLDFSDVRLILKLLYINFCIAILLCFVLYTVGKPADRRF